MIELNPVVKEDIKSILAEKSDWEKLRGKSVLISGVNGLIASYLVRTLLYLNDTQDYRSGFTDWRVMRRRHRQNGELHWIVMIFI